MRQTDAQEPTVFFYVEALGKVQGVVISIPREESTLTEPTREFERRVTFNSYRDCRTTLIEALGITDAVKLESGNREQAADQAFH